MSTSGNRMRAIAGIVAAVAIVAFGFFGAVAHGDVNPPIFLTRLGNVISTYPATAALKVGGAFTQGGGTTATTSQGTVTYTASMFDTESLILHTASAALTATLPASSTLSALAPKAGMSRKVCVAPITTGITFAGGTGTDLDTASSTKFIVAGGIGCFDFIRKTDLGDFEILMTSGL